MMLWLISLSFYMLMVNNTRVHEENDLLKFTCNSAAWDHDDGTLGISVTKKILYEERNKTCSANKITTNNDDKQIQ